MLDVGQAEQGECAWCVDATPRERVWVSRERLLTECVARVWPQRVYVCGFEVKGSPAGVVMVTVELVMLSP